MKEPAHPPTRGDQDRAADRICDKSIAAPQRWHTKPRRRSSFEHMRLQKAGPCSELVYPCLHIEIDNDDEFAMLESEILSALIATIHDAAPDPDLWTVALEGIRDLVDGCAASFHWQDERDGASIVLG